MVSSDDDQTSVVRTSVDGIVDVFVMIFGCESDFVFGFKQPSRDIVKK